MSRLFPEQQKPAPHQGPITRDRQPQRGTAEPNDWAQRDDGIQPVPGNSPVHVPNSDKRLGKR
jgi:hypothetical protein